MREFKNSATNQKLIQLVKSYPILYDKHMIDYGKWTRVNAAWKEIASILNLSTEVCRQRWRDIRDNYKKFLKRKSSSRRIVNSKYNDEQLKFLDEFLVDRGEESEIVYLVEDGYQTSCVTEKTPTIVSYETIPGGNSSSSEHNSGHTNSKRPLRRSIPPKRYADDISDPESAAEEVSHENSAAKEMSHENNAAEEMSHENCAAEEMPHENCAAEEMPHKKPLKQKRHSKQDLPKLKKLKTDVEQYCNSTNDGSREIVNVIKQERSVPEEENAIHIFFRSMASTVMTFPKHLIAETRMEVCNIVSKMELRALMENGLQICQVSND